MWSQAGMDKLIHDFKGTEFSDFLLFAHHKLNKIEFEKLCMLAWKVWSDRNALYHGRNIPPVKHQWEKLEVYLTDYQATQSSLSVQCRENANHSEVSCRRFWKAPPMDELILNTDATVNTEEGVISIGAVIHNHHGEVMGLLGKIIQGNYSPLIAEMLAIREGLEFAGEIGLRVHIVETDSLLSVQAINLHLPLSLVLALAEDCRILMEWMGNCFIRHSPRQTNQVAHELALLVKNSRKDFMYCEEVPDPIVKLVNIDASCLNE